MTVRPQTQACTGALVCLPLTGPMEGSGYGHCTAPAAPSNATATAGNATAPAKQFFVRNRATVDGRQCRLPLVYKCVLPPYPNLSHRGSDSRGCKTLCHTPALDHKMSCGIDCQETKHKENFATLTLDGASRTCNQSIHRIPDH